MTVSHGALKLSGKSPHSEETQMSTSSNATGPTKPTDDQAKAAQEILTKHAQNKKRAYEDILWALLNTKEFAFNK